MKNRTTLAASVLIPLAALLAAAPAHAQVKNCEQLRNEIASRTPVRSGYELGIFSRDETVQGSVYGTCEAGTRKIVMAPVGTASTAGSSSGEAAPDVVPPTRPDEPTAGGDDTLQRYRSWIAEARTRHPYAESEAQMVDVMMCESRGNASIVGPGGHTGLFQYAPATWKGTWNEYNAQDLRDAKAQIFATALAWSLGKQGWWGCYKKAPSSEQAGATSSVVPVSARTNEVAETSQRAAMPRPNRGRLDDETVARYRDWIAEARAKHPYPDSEDRMFAVMMCESGGNAEIVNRAGPYQGLFQYSPRTWSGDWNDYRDQNVFDARAQIFATAQAWSRRMQGQWGCYKRAH